MPAAHAQAAPARTELPGLPREFSEGTGPYSVSHGVPSTNMSSVQFLTHQDWHISSTYTPEQRSQLEDEQDQALRAEADESVVDLEKNA